MTGVSICRKTWFAVAFTAIAALVNLLLNLILIPKMGSTGAALSTLIAYILLAGIAYVVNQGIYPIPYQIGLFTIALIMGVAFYITGSFLAQNQGVFMSCAIYINCFCLYGGCLAIISIASRYWRNGKLIKHRLRSFE